jgi:hypothetical protein
MIGITLALCLIDIHRDTFSSTVGSTDAAPNQPQIHRAQPATNNQATKSNASIPIHINIS